MPIRVPARPWGPVLPLLALLLLPAARPAVAQAPAGELRIGLAELPASLDPALASSGPALALLRQVFETLVDHRDRDEFEPRLATGWEVSRNGLSWTFRLRPGVRFHDGTPVTAPTVAASLSRQLAGTRPESPVARPGVFGGVAAVVRGVRVVSPTAIAVELVQPYAPLLAILAHPAFAIALPAGNAPGGVVGTGPYRIAEASPERVVLELAAELRGIPPRTPRLVFRQIGDDATGITELGGDGLDIYFPRMPPLWGGLGLQVLSAPTGRLGLLALETDHGPLKERRLRQAVALALDPRLLEPALGRWATPYRALLPAGAWGLLDPLPLPPHDPARARRLVAEARLAPQTTLSLVVPDGGLDLDLSRVAEAVRVSLAVAGLPVEVRVEPAETFRSLVRNGEHDLAIEEVGLEVDDPHLFLHPLVSSEGAVRGWATNLAFYRSRQVDDLLFRASQIAFRRERLRLYQRVQTQLAQDLPWLPLYVRLQWALARPEVRDLRLAPSGAHPLEQAWRAPSP